MRLFKKKQLFPDTNFKVSQDSDNVYIEDFDEEIVEETTLPLNMDSCIDSNEEMSVSYINNNILSEDNTDVLTVLDIENIEDYKYQCMDKVITVNLINRINYLGNSSFAFCESLKDFNFVTPVDNLIIDNYCFRDCFNLTNFNFKGQITKIGSNAFSNCKKLKTINLESLTSISDNTFLFNMSLNNIKIPNVKIIECGAFMYCRSLQNIDLSICSKLKEIHSYAFSSCDLHTLHIPRNVELIDGYVFEENYNLIDVYFDHTDKDNIEIGNDIFKECKNVIVHTTNKTIIDYCKEFNYTLAR